MHKLAEELRRYQRRLLAFRIQAHGGFDSFIVQLHALRTNDDLPPPPHKVDDGESPLASLGPGSLSTALAGASTLSAANGASPLAEVDDPALHEALCWREFEEHLVRLLELGTGVAETTPFEEDARLALDRAHEWRVVGSPSTASRSRRDGAAQAAHDRRVHPARAASAQACRRRRRCRRPAGA